MRDPYENMFSSYDLPEPPDGLAEKIIRRIERVRRRSLIIKTTGFGAILAASVGSLVFGFINFGAQLSQSGFFEIASLFFSDFSSAVGNFQDFVFSMIESFPVFDAALLVGCAALAIWSAARFFEEIGAMHLPVSLSLQ